MKVPINNKNNNLPQYQTEGSIAFDFSANRDEIIAPKSVSKILTGCIIKVPEGYGLFIFARSSLYKYGLMLANSVGVLDNDYCGTNDEVQILVYNFTDLPVKIKKGTRIAQGVFIPIEKVQWISYTPASKSRGGIGSTGK